MYERWIVLFNNSTFPAVCYQAQSFTSVEIVSETYAGLNEFYRECQLLMSTFSLGNYIKIYFHSVYILK